MVLSVFLCWKKGKLRSLSYPVKIKVPLCCVRGGGMRAMGSQYLDRKVWIFRVKFRVKLPVVLNCIIYVILKVIMWSNFCCCHSLWINASRWLWLCLGRCFSGKPFNFNVVMQGNVWNLLHGGWVCVFFYFWCVRNYVKLVCWGLAVLFLSVVCERVAYWEI